MYDLLIRNAKILDGTGAPWFRGDVGVKDGYIRKIGLIDENTEARAVVDAKGKCLSPGFIDAHSHSDSTITHTPTAESKVFQGVTLEVVGQCGSSAAPKNMGFIEGNLGETRDILWTDMASWMSYVEQTGISVNIAPLVGHGTVRRQVMGIENRPPNENELETMKQLVSDAMNQGAFGISTGLGYVPSKYADTSELIELCKIVSEYGGIYATHLRNQSSHVNEAVEEAIEIGVEANLPVQISHIKCSGKPNWGNIGRTIELIEKARADGLDITADQYPYTASSNGIGLPASISQIGIEQAFKLLEDPVEKDRLLNQMPERDWEAVVISVVNQKEDEKYVGKSLKEIGDMQGLSPAESCLRLLLRNRSVRIITFSMCEEDVQTAMTVSWVMFGSDGRGLKTETVKGKQHPRSYGTFPRVLARYVRELKLLRLEEAIRKMTSLPAMRHDIKDRGLVKEGMRADLVVFDPDTVEDKATFDDPHQYAQGIDWVIVNGVPVIEDGKHTGARPGMVLRKNN